MHYSPSHNSFYLPEIHGDAIPSDAVEITADEHSALLEGQSQGKRIVADENGYPVLQDPPPLTLDEAKAAKLTEINAACDAEIEAIKVSYPDTEVMTWDKQEMEARALVLDAAADTLLIDSIASARGLDRVELANRIIANADQFATASGASLGKRQALKDEINAATTVEQVEEIVWGAQ